MGELGIDGLKNQVQQCIQYAYDRGARAEYKEMQDRWGEEKQKWIEQGREEAWEAARKIHVMFGKDIEKIFSKPSEHFVYSELSASEAIEKIKAWEEKKAEDDEVNVGDEIESGDTRYIVVRVDNDTFEGIGACGAVGLLLKNFHKTGRHFDQIAEVLEMMKEGE